MVSRYFEKKNVYQEASGKNITGFFLRQ